MEAVAEILTLHSQFDEALDDIVKYVTVNHGLREGQRIEFVPTLHDFLVNDSDGTCKFYGALCSDKEFIVLQDVQLSICPLIFLEATFHSVTIGCRGIQNTSQIKDLFTSDLLSLGYLRRQVEGQAVFEFYFVRSERAKHITDVFGPLDNTFSGYSYLTSCIGNLNTIHRDYQLAVDNAYAMNQTSFKVHCILSIVGDYKSEGGNIIDIRRWFPVRKETFTSAREVKHPGLYRMGSINTSPATDELAGFMDMFCSILFGTVDKNGVITVLGGLEQFTTGSLKDYFIPSSVISYIE